MARHWRPRQVTACGNCGWWTARVAGFGACPRCPEGMMRPVPRDSLTAQQEARLRRANA